MEIKGSNVARSLVGAFACGFLHFVIAILSLPVLSMLVDGYSPTRIREAFMWSAGIAIVSSPGAALVGGVAAFVASLQKYDFGRTVLIGALPAVFIGAGEFVLFLLDFKLYSAVMGAFGCVAMSAAGFFYATIATLLTRPR